MIQKRIRAALLTPVVVLVASAIAIGPTTAQTAEEMERPASLMDARIKQVVEQIETGKNCTAVGAAIGLGLDVLYGGLRPVPSHGALERTVQADKVLGASELRLAAVLGEFLGAGRCPEHAGAALDLKIFVEEMNEVALAVGRITRECGEGADLRSAPCDQLRPELDELTGHRPDAKAVPRRIAVGYSVKLRGPFIPRYVHRWEEDVLTTEPIDTGQCVVVFKETKGLMLQLVFVGVTVVADPWATATLARGTRIPIWSLRWIPSEYVKEWNICNTGRGIEKTVTQRVKQDIPLNYFWRYYPKSP